MTTGRINQVSRLCFTDSSAVCNTPHKNLQTRTEIQFFQFRVNCTGAVRQLNRLSNIRLFKLRQSHENKSHGDWSPPRNYTLFQLDRLNASVLTYRDTLLPCAVLCWCFTTPLLRSHSQAVQAEKRTSLTVFLYTAQQAQQSTHRAHQATPHCYYILTLFFFFSPSSHKPGKRNYLKILEKIDIFAYFWQKKLTWRTHQRKIWF